MMSLISFALPVMGCFAVLIAVIWWQGRRIASQKNQMAELHRKNNALTEELNYANTRKNIEQSTTQLSDAAVFDSLQQSGYYRD